ncbi:DNA/RNA helicase domain-containing protein [Marinomonas sp. GJ51-6]|uniref:DNA/RNA helicase domain-containing protein n=1 Tax=Marinomonas sp. GJ51-6 TaxID=2992802 RepID=UPI00293528B4|nr:DNA/RNA helicase domain-containing protein [Marinomonas sp. GJ51-6]WOD06680.1 DNA/RNA helicase domain-containing protein [Marinomonas sp. GJ51-6]
MIVYSATKREFIDDVRSNKIAEIIENEVLRKLNRNSPRSETLSWENSLQYMSQVLWDEDIPASAGVSIEYNLPMTNRRVDFILTGKDHNRNDSAVIIELKQWQEAKKTDKDAIVKTRFQHGEKETNHPSYQAWSYSALIEDYNETVRKESIRLQPCAYLHNMKSGDVLNDPFYSHHTGKAPVFISQDALKLSEFLKRHVKFGDSDNIMYRIEHGVIKPSKNLADALASMLNGNSEFLMIDEQKLVYETAISLAHIAQKEKKQTLIVKGGPGTGKSVVAINLLSELTKRDMLVQYVSKNAAPREVFKKKLTGSKKKTHIDQMFKGSGAYTEVEANQFGALLIDEAHRLNEKSGLYGNLGENQIKELILGSRFNVFFIDEAQRVTLQDIGNVETIKSWAQELESEVTELSLVSQFRCNGSDGYLSWVDNCLQIRETANQTLDDIDYDVQVFDDPNVLRAAIVDKNRLTNKARLVAGYCWDWNSKKDKSASDIVIPEYNFEAQWNLTEDGSLWMIAEKSVEQVGCIHTCQGLELDYIGVIIGDDFVIRDGIAVTNANNRSSNDRSIRGFKKLLKEAPEKARKVTDEIIKNTYRTLMTRGQKGCYLFCTDPETRDYFLQLAARKEETETTSEPYQDLELPIASFDNAMPYKTHVPIYDLYAAAGGFSEQQNLEECSWVELPDHINIKDDMFVMRVVGESMNRRIANGSWCLFRANPAGTRNGKIVLVQHREIEDPDHGGSYTIKLYHSEKTAIDGEQINTRITLKPDTNAFGYSPIILDNPEEDLTVIGEYLGVIG